LSTGLKQMQFQQQKSWQVIPPIETGRGWPDILLRPLAYAPRHER
jgi:hypothetical protein